MITNKHVSPFRLKTTMGSFVKRIQPPMLVLFYATRQKEKYLAQFMRLFLDANQKPPVYQDQ